MFAFGLLSRFAKKSWRASPDSQLPRSPWAPYRSSRDMCQMALCGFCSATVPYSLMLTGRVGSPREDSMLASVALLVFRSSFTSLELPSICQANEGVSKTESDYQRMDHPLY